MNSMIKNFSFLLSPKTWFEPIVFPGSLAVLKSRGEAAPNSRRVPRRLRWRNAFGLIQEYCTSSNFMRTKRMERFLQSKKRTGFFAKTFSAYGGSREIP